MTQVAGRTSNWGRWGPKDERGALNLLTPEVVLEAMKSAKTGKVYSLGVPMGGTNVPVVGQRQPPQRFTVFNSTDASYWAGRGRDDELCIGEDYLALSSHTVTHMDALAHIWLDGQLYNGFSDQSVQTYKGAVRCGIDKTKVLAGRAVLLDMARHFGVDYIEPPRMISAGDLLDCAGQQGVEIRAGDTLLFRTGWLRVFYEDKDRWLAGQPGLALDACRLIGERDIVAVGSDNATIEAVPYENDVFLQGHVELIRNLGVHLMELMALDEMAADQAYEAFLVVAPLVIKGAMGSPVNPIAIA